MKFLKVLTNSLLSGIFFSALLALLIYDININIPFQIGFFLQLTLYLCFTYGVIIALLCLFIFFVVRFISGRAFNIAFVSPSFLTLSFSFLTLFYFVVFKFNYDYFLTLFDDVTRELIKSQTWGLIFLVISGFLIIYGASLYRKKVFFFLAYFLLFGGLMTYSVSRRAAFPLPVKSTKITRLAVNPPVKKITIIGLSGMTFDILNPLITKNLLPNISELINNGCWGNLQSLTPSDRVPLTQSFNTGKWPSRHRVLSPLTYQLLNLKQELEVVPRYMFFRQLTRIGLLLTHPHQTPSAAKDIWTIFEEFGINVIRRDNPYPLEVAEPDENTLTQFDLFYKDLKFETEPVFIALKNAFYADSQRENAFNTERKAGQPEIIYLLLDGLNTVESFFYRYSFPELFGDVDPEEITKSGTVIERYYQFYDSIIGKYLSGIKENELLIVFSPHGIEPLPLWKRFIEFLLGNSSVSAYHDLAPDGVVFFFGQEVARRKTITGVRLIDLAPTILYFMGMHVGKDMDGDAQPHVFREEFREDTPVLYISSYDEYTVTMKK